MSDRPSIVKIDARVSSYEGAPIRVVAVCFPASGRIKIQKIANYAEPAKRENDTVLVTDSPTHFDSWQLAFYEKVHLDEAMKTYFEIARGGKLRMESDINKFDPAQVLQIKKMDKGGVVHEFDSSAVNNGHMAVLLAVWASAKASMGYLISSDPVAIADDDDDPMMPFTL